MFGKPLVKDALPIENPPTNPGRWYVEAGQGCQADTEKSCGLFSR
jgi:hypothetical protein